MQRLVRGAAFVVRSHEPGIESGRALRPTCTDLVLSLEILVMMFLTSTFWFSFRLMAALTRSRPFVEVGTSVPLCGCR
jgi:hypothetical protein